MDGAMSHLGALQQWGSRDAAWPDVRPANVIASPAGAQNPLNNHTLGGWYATWHIGFQSSSLVVRSQYSV